jgi:hypothetical protein
MTASRSPSVTVTRGIGMSLTAWCNHDLFFLIDALRPAEQRHELSPSHARHGRSLPPGLPHAQPAIGAARRFTWPKAEEASRAVREYLVALDATNNDDGSGGGDDGGSNGGSRRQPPKEVAEAKKSSAGAPLAE